MTNNEEVAVQRFVADGSEIAVFEFQGRIRDLMVSSLTTSLLTTGSYTDDGKAISPHGVMSMVAAGSAAGGTALSAAFSGSLFMATANPATLMTIGNGVGSAVMGAGGIVAQAPFIAVASSIPVVAPLMAMQAMTTVMMLQQFDKMDRKLDAIKGALDTAIARAEATHAGELAAASVIVDEVYRQYNAAGSFSNDMLIRMALAEHDIRRLTERFRYLVDGFQVANVDDIESVQRANYDAHSAMLASFLDVRIAYLRVCVDMQENPKSMSSSVEQLKSKIRDGVEFWKQLVQRSDGVRSAISEREKQLNDMNWVARSMPEFIGGKGAAAERNLTALKAAYVSTLEGEMIIMKGFDSLIQSTQETLVALENPQANAASSPVMVYWKDESGEHSFATERLHLAQAA
ncbi:hypothetical protein [Microcella humidisoli]|uniref:Uncharacterized protein n=1 Tax=Microcella humidisoli TaxID=2963406 RepID=A0ABY5FXH3_9MICO|nr:hypothetical protein [Microcella humidisoli]UTT62585.1 hypothetical protein NNL39_00230 [Microcella humidisoli]